MEFHEKAAFFNEYNQDSNIALAQATFLDASHISRLRRGERKLVKDAAYIRPMADIFCRQCYGRLSKKALLEALQQPTAELQNPDKTAEAVYRWLLAMGDKEADAINGFLDGMVQIPFKKADRS